MTPPNPAVRLYNFWHTIMEYQNPGAIEDARERLQHYVDACRKNNSGATWSYLRPDVEKYSLDSASTYYNQDARLDYRMGIHVVGLSDRHLGDEPTLFEGLDDWQPIIQLSVGWRYRRYNAMMTLWPNGDFRIDTPPQEGAYIIYPRWTFFRTTWIAHKRQWLPEQPGIKKVGRDGWVSVDEKNFHNPVPYVHGKTFKRGAHYRLVWDGRYWKFMSQYGLPDGNFLYNHDHAAKQRLDDAYAQCERRYERNRRISICGPTENRIRKIALYVPKHGRMTGMEAVQEFTQHMRVYQPVEATEEATHGSDSLVASPVHQ